MKIIKKELARALAELPEYYTNRKLIKWKDLPHYKQLTYEAEADRFFQAVKVLENEIAEALKRKTKHRVLANYA